MWEPLSQTYFDLRRDLHSAPVSKTLPYQWHNTPNVRVLTIRDFEALAPEVGIEILDRAVLHGGQSIRWGANWRGSLAVYRVKRS